MRHSLCSLGILLALALIVTGCGDGGKTPPTKSEPSTPPTSGQTTSPAVNGNTSQSMTSHPSQEVVRQFLLHMNSNNDQGAFALLTPFAQEEYRKSGTILEPKEFQDMTYRITGSAPLLEVDPNCFGVYVDMVSGDELFDTIWCVRKIGDSYRIANLMVNYDGEMDVLDFEDPVAIRKAKAKAENWVDPQPSNMPQPQTPLQYPPQTAQPIMPVWQ